MRIPAITQKATMPSGRANAVGGYCDAHWLVHNDEAQNGRGNQRQTYATVEDEIDPIARDAQHGLADEVKDRAANRRTHNCGM